MKVEPELSEAILDGEFADAKAYGEPLAWTLERTNARSVRASITAAKRGDDAPEVFVFDFSFDDYRAVPPLIDLIHPETGVKNKPECFPEGSCLGYFHDKKRICAEWSRRAYKDFSGPHPEWDYDGWENRCQPPVGTLSEMLTELWRALTDASYTGRAAG